MTILGLRVRSRHRDDPTGTVRVPVLPRAHRPRVLALAGGFFALYALVGLLRYRALEENAYDLGIFFDAVRHWAHFSLPYVAVKGVHAGFGPHFDLLGDHFHPILALLAPTFWVWPHPQTLILDQAALVAASTVPVWSFSHRRLHSARAAYVIASAYALYWGLQQAVAFDFHEIAFAVPLIALAIERIDAGRWLPAIVAIVLLVFVKEDLTILVVFFGVYVAIKGRRLTGALLLGFGVAAYAVITKVAMPALGGHPYPYWSYGRLGADLPSALWHIVRHPLATAHLLVSPAVKWHTMIILFAPFLFLTLASPILLLAVPLVAERFLSSGAQYWSTSYHYSATIAPIVAMGAADGLARVAARFHGHARWPAVQRTALVAIGVTALALLGVFRFRELAEPHLWVGSADITAGTQALAAVPSHVVVEASNELQPHLTDRTDALLLDGRQHGASYVAANVAQHKWPYATLARQRAFVTRLEDAGWHVVMARGPYVVLRRPSGP